MTAVRPVISGKTFVIWAANFMAKLARWGNQEKKKLSQPGNMVHVGLGGADFVLFLFDCLLFFFNQPHP